MLGENPQHGGSVIVGKILFGYQRGWNVVDKLTEILEAKQVEFEILHHERQIRTALSLKRLSR